MTWLGLAVAAALGAPARFIVDGWLSDKLSPDFPWGTFVVNVSGSLLFGFVAGLGLYHALPTLPRVILGAGFCGSYTTFSTWAFETTQLAERGARAGSAGNLVGSALAGLLAGAVGLAAAALL